MRNRHSRIRIRIVSRREVDPTDPPCITCNKPGASYPPHAASKRFCNKKCAAFYAVVVANDWAWCRTHLVYWDRLVRDHCPECPRRMRVGSTTTQEDIIRQALGRW